MSDPAAVLSYYIPQPAMVRRIKPLANAGGWSGSQLWRVTVGVGSLWRDKTLPRTLAPAAKDSRPPCADDTESLCLRRWPRDHPTPDRLTFIHATLARAASLNFIPVPIHTTSGQTFIEHAGHLWELTPWMPGVANCHTHPSPPRLRAAFQALAQFHASTAQTPTSGPAPAILERRDRLAELRSSEVSAIQAATRHALNTELDTRAQRILEIAPLRLAALAKPLEHAARQPLALQPAIRDIHHDHVLFTGDEVTGLIDFGAMRVDTPLTDIARLLGSLVGDDQPAREAALAAYAELRPLSAADRQLIDLLDQATLVLSGLNWLTWLYLERRDMGPAAPIAHRLDQILSRLQSGPVIS